MNSSHFLTDNRHIAVCLGNLCLISIPLAVKVCKTLGEPIDKIISRKSLRGVHVLIGIKNAYALAVTLRNALRPLGEVLDVIILICFLFGFYELNGILKNTVLLNFSPLLVNHIPEPILILYKLNPGVFVIGCVHIVGSRTIFSVNHTEAGVEIPRSLKGNLLVTLCSHIERKIDTGPVEVEVLCDLVKDIHINQCAKVDNVTDSLLCSGELGS